MIFFSKSTKGFYLKSLHAGKIPEDAVEITEDEHFILLQGQSAGKIISVDEQGFPTLTEPPSKSLTRQEIEVMRLQAYADPVYGSDRYFSEALSLEAIGAPSEEVESVRQMGLARKMQIVKDIPWELSYEG